MTIFVNSDTRVIVQGMTGSEGMKHTQRMLASGTPRAVRSSLSSSYAFHWSSFGVPRSRKTSWRAPGTGEGSPVRVSWYRLSLFW